MGPAFNPFFWLTCIAFLVVAVIIAPISGVIAYFVSTPLAKVIKAKPNQIRLLVAIGTTMIIFFVTFCGLWEITSPFAPPSPWFKPTEKDIIGVWEVTPGSKWFMEERGGYEISRHILEFKGDGTFTMINMPDWWDDGFGDSNGEFDSGRGIWDIQRDINWQWSIGVQFTNLNGQGESLGTWFNLMGRSRPYKIYLWLGDPDEGNILTFEKRS